MESIGSDFLKKLKDAFDNLNLESLKKLWEKISDGDKSQDESNSNDFDSFLNYAIDHPIEVKSEKWVAVWYAIFKKIKKIQKIPKKGENPFIVLLSEKGNFDVLLLLLQHPTLKPNLRHYGPNADTPLHYLCQKKQGTEEESYQQCMQWLVNHSEVDVNALNCDFKTPLNLAIDVVNQTAKSMLEDSERVVYNDERVQVLQNAFKDFINFVKRGEDPATLSFSEMYSWLKIANNSENLEIDPYDGRILCLAKDFENFTEVSLKILLQEASRENFCWAVRHLLKNGADACATDEWNDDLSAIEIADKLEKILIFPHLLEKVHPGEDRKINERILCRFIGDDEVGRKLPSSIHLNHASGWTVLHFASQEKCLQAMYRILKASGIRLMGAITNAGQIVPYIPDKILDTGVVTSFLNSKVTANNEHYSEKKNLLHVDDGNRDSPNTSLDLDFLIDSQMNGNYNFRMDNLMEMSKIEKYHQYLIHPVIKIFLLSRWDSLKWIYYLNLFFSSLLTLFLTLNILWTTITPTDSLTPRILQGLFIFLLLLRESTQCFVQRKEYFNLNVNFENYFEMAIILCGTYLTFAGKDHFLYQHFGAIVILIAWLQLMLLIGKAPYFSIQLAMFKLVFISAAKFLFFYSMMIVAFGFSFFILLKPSCSNQLLGLFGFNDILCNDTYNEFTGVDESIFRSFVMMVGELDAPNLPFENYPVTSHIIFLLFVFTVVIVLFNLLNGLAVYDIQLIKQDASKYTHLENLKYLALLDKFSALLPNNLVFGLRTMKSKYQLNDYEIWKELYEIINKQESEFIMAPRVGKVQSEELSKEIDDLKKKQSQDADLIKQILSIVEELNCKLNKNEENIE